MSSKDVLSEGEIDALMDSVSSGDVPLETSADKLNYQSFDFSTREQALVAQMPGLRALFEKQAGLLAENISRHFRTGTDITAEDIKVLDLEDAMVSIPERSALNRLRLSPLNGTSLLVINGDLLSILVNHLFGGSSHVSSAKPGSSSARHSLSPTENRINELVSHMFVGGLEQSWKEKLAIKPELIGDSEPTRTSHIGSPDEQVLQFHFELQGHEWTSSILWIVPYAMLEPVRARFGGVNMKAASRSSQSWESEIRNALLSMDVELTAHFPEWEVSLAEVVLAYKAGSIISLNEPSEALLKIDGEVFGIGEYGENNKKKSVKLREVFK